MRNCIRKSIRPVLIICINKCSITISLVQGRLLPFSTAQPTKVSLYNCVLSISQSSCIYVNSQSCSSAPWPIHHITIVFVIIHFLVISRGAQSVHPLCYCLLFISLAPPPALVHSNHVVAKVVSCMNPGRAFNPPSRRWVHASRSA